MNQNNGKRKNITSAISHGLSKPSRQSLVARGLAANEDHAGKRLREQYQVAQKPGYMFYSSSDSDADQVYSMNKRLDRCSSLLKKASKEDAKPAIAKASNARNQKKEAKKVVKIVLPSAVTKPIAPGPRLNSAGQKTKMVTSTPNVKQKTKTKPKKEGELLQELAKVEREKSLLQEQYSELLQQHLATMGNRLGSSSEDRNDENQVHYIKENIAKPIDFTAAPFRSESNKIQDISSNHASSSVFEELEKTIAGISEKLSFPRSRTPSVSRSTERTGDVDCESTGLSYKTQDITPKREAEKDSFLSRDSSHTSKNISGEFFPLWPSADLPVAHAPKYCLYSSDSLEEGSYYCSSKSESDFDRTLIAENARSLSSSSVNSEVPSPQSKTEGQMSKNSGIENHHRAFDRKRSEPIVKTVRFMQVPPLDRPGNVSSCDEVVDISTRPPQDGGASFDVNEAVPITSDAVRERGLEKALPLPHKKDENSNNAIQLVPRDEERNVERLELHQKTLRTSDAKEANGTTVNSKSNERDKDSETANGKKQFFESPNGFGHKSSMDVVSQLSHINNPKKSPPRESPSRGSYAGGIKPGFAATQITALSYLFKDLMKLLSDRINSEEDRLLTEIDHMIGLLPFLISNLNPDLQTEVSLAVQPLRVENSGLRRQLRIANQKIRDFESKIVELNKMLKEAEKRAVDETKLEKLRVHINQDEAEQRKLKEKIDEINKTILELRGENQKLIQQMSEKDHEVLKQKQLWQKEKTSIYTEHDVAKKKIESLFLTLQAQEKQNRILQLSLSQSEAEIVRVKELNRDLRDSVAKLLRDVNYKEQRIPDVQRKSTFDKQLHDNAFKSPDLFSSLVEKGDHVPNHKTYPSRLNPLATERPKVAQQRNGMNSEFGEYSEIAAESTAHEDKGKSRFDSFESLSDQNSDISSASDLAVKNDSTSVGRSIFVDDQLSILTCDSREFQSNLANLSSKIRQMQESLYNAKRT